MARDRDLIAGLAEQARGALENKLDPKKAFSERNLKKKRGAFPSCFIAALLLVLMSAAAAVYVNAASVERFENALLKNVDFASLGVDETSVRSFARETIFYLTDAQDSWEPQIVVAGFPASRFIPQAFRDHMATVKGWMSAATAVFVTGAGVVLLLLLRALTGSGRNGGFSLGGYYLGAAVPVLITGGLVLWASLDFTAMWSLLHKALIPDGIFPAGELVMQLFPETLFAAYLPPVARLFGLLLAAVLALPLLLSPLSALLAKSRAASHKRFKSKRPGVRRSDAGER